ncbi:hypothetical protein AIOL_002622 [Candidatus Rhodobacter oscarellae]|uniref:Cupin type-2 domain-containing protein n=1 Tax=Candidatus Rhodobacter oscarellae TaxID=1675527 RepID=A0A0J9E4K5_9RHOB|nr:cupin domain-containing protein [Candidatus Rhodobacter lobularis]KMW57657.1 hypothetical protein AIOL_002622 [Candidatus Rhodobacter lobularis]
MIRAILFFVLVAFPAAAQDLILREEISRNPAPGSETHEVIVSRLEVKPGGTVPRHMHAGDEYLVVIQGGTMAAPDGSEIPFPTGTNARFPAGQPHGGLTNVGQAPLVAITTHIVEIGKPLNLPVE